MGRIMSHLQHPIRQLAVGLGASLLFLSVVAFVVAPAALTSSRAWEVHELPDGGRLEIRTESGLWAESIEFDNKGRKVARRYWDTTRRMHEIQYAPDGGDEIRHEIRD